MPQGRKRPRGQFSGLGTARAWSRPDSPCNRPGSGRWRFPGRGRAMTEKEQGRWRTRGRQTFAVHLLCTGWVLPPAEFPKPRDSPAREG